MYEIVTKELNTNTPKYPKKAFDRSLIKLLENEKIKIIGYDPSKDGRTVKQAFKSETLIFDSSERLTRPKIQNLLNKMEDNDEAYQRIRERFKDKMSYLNVFYSNRWSFLNKGTFSVAPTDFEYLFADFGFYDDIIDMISELSEKQKEAYIEDCYGDSEKADLELCDEVYSRIARIIDDVSCKIMEKEEREIEIEMKKEDPEFEDSFNMLNDEYLGEEYYTDYDLYELIENMASILILLNKYEEEKYVKVWLYPMYPFQFHNIWTDFKEHLMKKDKNVTIDTLLDSTYALQVDKHGFWDKKEALKFGGYENYSEKLKTPNKAFEHVMDIIFTYSDEERKILIRILAKGLSDEPDSLRVFAEFYKKINAVNYPKRLNKVLGIVSTSQKTVR